MACDDTKAGRILPAAFAWALLLFATGLFFAYPCWYLTVTYSIAIPIVQAVITFFVIANFTLATCLDPGVIPKAHPDEFERGETEPLYVDVEIKSIKVRLKWCMTCHFFRPPRCTHCGICDSCIERFDHHCPWINNCIGRRNYRFFFLFLLWLSIHIISILSLCVLYMQHHLNSIHEIHTIITIVIIGIIVVLFIPILGLTAYHIALIFRGRTTNEQVTGKFYDISNPYSNGCANNMLHTLCSSPYPSFKIKSAEYEQRLIVPHLQLETSDVRASDRSYYLQGADKNLSVESSVVARKSHFQEYEPSPLLCHKDRNNRDVNINHSLHGKDISSYRSVKGSRALTPPVSNQGNHRFHHLRRSLPLQNRPHSSNQQLVDENFSVPAVSIGELTVETKYINSVGYASNSQHLNNYQLGSTVFTLPVHHHHLDGLPDAKEHEVSVLNNSPGISVFLSPKFKGEKNSLQASDTCCLGNQMLDKLQELANTGSAVSPLSVHTCMQGTLHKQCSNFCGIQNESTNNYEHSSSVHSPISVVGNSHVDYQQGSEPLHSGLREEHISSHLSHVPGRRPLSFVKAIEMSDTLEEQGQKLLSTPSNFNHSQQEDDSRCGVSYEIRV